MYSFVFCRVFIVLVDFRIHCVTTVTPFVLPEGKNVNCITPRNASLSRLWRNLSDFWVALWRPPSLCATGTQQRH